MSKRGASPWPHRLIRDGIAEGETCRTRIADLGFSPGPPLPRGAERARRAAVGPATAVGPQRGRSLTRTGAWPLWMTRRAAPAGRGGILLPRALGDERGRGG